MTKYRRRVIITDFLKKVFNGYFKNHDDIIMKFHVENCLKTLKKEPNQFIFSGSCLKYSYGSLGCLFFCKVLKSSIIFLTCYRNFNTSLITNIQKLFSEKVDVFMAVDFNRVSIMTGIVKICLKVGFRSPRIKYSELITFEGKKCDFNTRR